MKIFVLDDDDERIHWFQLLGEEVEYAHDPKEAEYIISNDTFDIIFLDHDLGGPYRGPCGDGIDLANIMASNLIHTSTPIVVHSMNYGGATNILNALRNTHNKLFRCNFCILRQFNINKIEQTFLKS